jgi:formylglycine-generating enzyme
MDLMRTLFVLIPLIILFSCSSSQTQLDAQSPLNQEAKGDLVARQEVVAEKPLPQVTMVNCETKVVGPNIKLICIPGGSYTMGNSAPDAYITEKPAHKVNLKSFWMGETEVTNAQYATFLNESKADWDHTKDWLCAKGETRYSGEFLIGDGLTSHIIADYTNSRWSVEPGWEDQPVVCVSWAGAEAFCKYYKLRLPTESEWEYAGGGPTHTRYPWGDEFDKRMACGVDNHGTGVPATMPVKSFQPNPWELYDMSGNVWEWVGDWYSLEYYAQSPASNPPGPPKTDRNDKVFRGGGYDSPERELTCTVRSGTGAHFLPDGVGFRVAGD